MFICALKTGTFNATCGNVSVKTKKIRITCYTDWDSCVFLFYNWNDTFTNMFLTKTTKISWTKMWNHFPVKSMSII